MLLNMTAASLASHTIRSEGCGLRDLTAARLYSSYVDCATIT